jgi:hypothetical protein
MSQYAIKKHLQSLTKEQIIGVVAQAYGNSKAVREYFDFYLHPDETEKVRKYKTIIEKEFGVIDPMKAGLRYSVAKKAISDFTALKPSAESLADVMLTLPEAACHFTHEYGDMQEAFYDSAYNNFKRVLEFIRKNGLLDKFKARCGNCVEWASPCGYGFADGIADLYYEYYGDDGEFE